MEDKFTIHLTKLEKISGISIPFNISKKDEAKYREAEKQLGNVYDKYINNLKNSSLKNIDIVALLMAGLELSLKKIEADTSTEFKKVNQEISEINDDLHQYISKQ